MFEYWIRCLSCGREFKRASHLKTHLRSNCGGNKAYICPICAKSFSNVQSLTVRCLYPIIYSLKACYCNSIWAISDRLIKSLTPTQTQYTVCVILADSNFRLFSFTYVMQKMDVLKLMDVRGNYRLIFY